MLFVNQAEAILAELLALSSDFDHVTTHVVFVHGLGGDKESTWLSSGSKREVWLRWLSEDFTHVAVWSVGYDAAPTKWKGFSMHLPDRAENVLALLLAESRLAAGNLILVGHSLGGLLIKQVLRSADRSGTSEQRARSFLGRVRRVAFIGTPHQGAFLADLARALGLLVRPSSSTNALERNDPNLRDLNLWYRAFVSKHSIENLILVETRRRGLLGGIVKPDSSDPGVGVTAPVPIDANHINIVKLAGRHSEVYVHVSDFVSRAFEAEQPTTLVVERITESIRSITTEQTAATRQQIVATREQTAALEAIEQSIAANTLVVSESLARSSVDTTVIDNEAQERLARIVRARFFTGFNAVEYVTRLIASVSNGDLAKASHLTKREIFSWCSRLLSSVDLQEAKRLLGLAETYGAYEVSEVSQAFIVANEKGTSFALQLLAKINTPFSRSAAFMILNHHGGITAALRWLSQAELTATDLDPDGKFFVLHGRLQTEDWDDAVAVAMSLSEADFERTPMLFFTAADAYLTSAVPLELRAQIFARQMLFDWKQFPLALDQAALENRRRAQHLFELGAEQAKYLGLSDAGNFGRDQALWLALRDSERSDPARKELLQSMREPANSLRRFPLALQFGLDIDLGAVEREIDRVSALTGGMSRDAAFARFALVYTQKGPGEGAAYIDRHRKQISDVLDPTILEIEMLARAGQTQKAEEKLNQLTVSGLGAADQSRLQRLINEGVGNDPVEQRLALYKNSSSLANLNTLVIALEETNDWRRLVEFAAIAFAHTHDMADAWRYAQALYHTGQLDEIFDLFEKYPSLLAESDDFRMLRCWALYRRGDLIEARESLGALSKYQQTESYRTLTTSIAIASGDWESLHVFAEAEWIAREERSARDLLRAAKLAQLVGSPRSKELTFEAARRASEDARVLIGCYNIALESAWEDSAVVGSWMRGAAALSDENGPVQRMSLQDLIDRQPTWASHASETWKLYERGQIPIFAVADATHRSLLSLFLLPALANPGEMDVRKRSNIYAFSGARSAIDVDPSSIAMDATALLNAEISGMRQLLFEHFSEVVIAHSTLSWLFDERQKIVFHQPSRVKRAHELRRLIDSGALLIFDRLASMDHEVVVDAGEDLGSMIVDATALRPEDGRQRVVVTQSPVHRVGSLMKEETNLEKYVHNICSCFSLVDKLMQKGELTATRAQDCKAYLTMSGNAWPDEPSIEDTAVLYLDRVTISHLQHLDLLPSLKRIGLTAFVSTGAVEECDALIAYDAHAAKAASVVESLRAALRNGIESRKVRVARMIESENNEDSPIFRSHPTIAVLGFRAVVDALVIDDRAVNRHVATTYDGAPRPILTSLDVCSILCARGVITHGELFELRTVLRRAGMSHISLDANELEHCLSQASVVEGKVVETAELRAIRESVLGLAMTDALQLPDEAIWLDSSAVACYVALKAQWQEEADEATASAKSDWILKIWDARRWSHRTVGVAPNAEVRYRAQLLALVTLAAGQSASVRNTYWKWLDQRVLRDLHENHGEIYDELVANSAVSIEKLLQTISPGMHDE